MLLLTMHHIVSDGWSLGVLVRELGALYRGFASGRGGLAARAAGAVRGLRPVAARVAERGGARPPAGVLADAACRGAPGSGAADGPSAPAGADASRRSALLCHSPGGERGADGAGRREGATLFMMLLAAFDVLLSRYTGRRTWSWAPRSRTGTGPEIEGLIGFFVNTLVLRTDLSGDPDGSGAAGAGAGGVPGGLRPPGPAVREAGGGAAAGAGPEPEPALPGDVRPPERPGGAVWSRRVSSLTPVRAERGTSKFDLTLILEETPEGLDGALRVRDGPVRRGHDPEDGRSPGRAAARDAGRIRRRASPSFRC